MKKYLIGGILFCMLSTCLNAQQNVKSPMYDDMIVQIPDISVEKNLQSVVNALIDVNGVKYVGFCNSLKCLLLQVDRNMQPVNDELEITLKNTGLNFYIKQDASIKLVEWNCKDIKGKNNQKQIGKSK